LAGRDYSKLEKVIDEKIAEYGDVNFSAYKMYAIGGTATTIASVYHGLKVYDPKIVDGTEISAEKIQKMAKEFISLSVDKVKEVAGMDARRADIIGGGCLLMYKIMQKIGLKYITVSERDNLEGYVTLKCGD
jgi:exopolyphosphatase/guanosine-5'-triphosphate,3'-diphosphate pyrophosphatase